MATLLAGTEVQARGLRWTVVYAQTLGLQTLYRLRGLDGAMRGQEMDFLSPLEPVEPIVQEFRPERAAPLAAWLVYHQAFLLEQALGPDALLAAQPGRLRLEPYQLVPVLRALRMSRVRLFLADSVGLGKTIQAGLVLTELIARRIAHRILIVSPAGPLLEQWRTELSDRFGLRVDVLDRARLEEIRRGTELGANPFDHIPLGLVSIDFLKQERVLEQLERSSYDVVVIDEAHHCMEVGAGGDREDSLRRRLAEVLARRCDALVLATATPHDGNDRSFASLCELLDPSLVDGRGVLRGEAYKAHVVRRLKRHIKDPKTGQPLFRERKVHPVAIATDPVAHAEFRGLHTALLELVGPELRRAFRARRYDDVLSFIALLKRSVSTVAALRSTLEVVAERFGGILKVAAEGQEGRRQRLRTLREYERKVARFGSLSAEEEAERGQLEAEDLAQSLAALQREVRSSSAKVARRAEVVEQLDSLVEKARIAEGQDPKLEALVRSIRDIRQEEPGANVLVYTEYTTSQVVAIAALRRAGVGEVVSMSGEDGDDSRKEITERFRSHGPLILVSTDAAAEGLNLHDRCHHLLHLELPFNPNRLEQRNGRIDRYGQEHDPIVRYFVLRGTFEERILWRLIAKYERQRARLTFVPNTLGLSASGDASAEKLLKGLMDENARLFKEPDGGTLFDLTKAAENEGSDEATREVLEEIDHVLGMFEKASRSNAWLGEAGLNSQDALVTEASKAREAGDRVTSVVLADFVSQAVLLEGGTVAGKASEPVFTIDLPPEWCHGLAGFPGWDPKTRRMRLTTRIEVIRDAADAPVSFLGRAHPLVRRALDRVRHLSYGADVGVTQDRRVSVVAADVREATLLTTLLGRVMSKAGREFERVLAVKSTRSGNVEFLPEATEWLPLADPSRAQRTEGAWDKHFAAWGMVARERGLAIARERFHEIAVGFVRERTEELEGERASLDRWLRERLKELTSGPASKTETRNLFEDAGRAPKGRPIWVTSEDPVERLAAYATDVSLAPAQRSEAEGVLRIYKARRGRLEDRLALGEPEVLPLGFLMIVPEARRGS